VAEVGVLGVPPNTGVPTPAHEKTELLAGGGAILKQNSKLFRFSAMHIL
jgi:hypothetical protein